MKGYKLQVGIKGVLIFLAYPFMVFLDSVLRPKCAILMRGLTCGFHGLVACELSAGLCRAKKSSTPGVDDTQLQSSTCMPGSIKGEGGITNHNRGKIG